MTIAVILQRKGHEVVHLSPDTTLQAAAALLMERRIGCAPVIDGGTVVGIFSERDVVRSVGAKGASVLDQPISSEMTSPAVTVAPDMRVLAALSLMTQRRIRHLPVLDGGRMVGFVSIGDLVKYRMDRIESEAAAMRDYIQGA